VAFTDTFPSGLTAASPSNLTSTCGGVAVYASGPPINLSLSGGTIAANSSCAISANVVGATPGVKVNTTSTVTSNEEAPGAAATGSITVTALAPTMTKAFGAATIAAGGTTSVTITITNPNASPLTGVAFTDTFPSGLTAASPSNLTGTCGGVAVYASGPPINLSLSGGTIAANSSCTISANVVGTTPGVNVNVTSTVTSNEAPAGSSANATITVTKAPTTTTLTSSLNPSSVGQPVTFTATVAGGATGNVTFADGATTLATVALSSGVATFTTSTLTLGSHSITATYSGDGTHLGSTSAALIQTVQVPADSLRLRALQVLVTPTVAQVSGQAISGAVDSAIGEAFNGGGALVAPSGNGVRFNFSSDSDGVVSTSSKDPSSTAYGAVASDASRAGPQSNARTRLDETFNALAYAGATKAPPVRVAELKEWLGWAEVRGATLDRWGGLSPLPNASALYGSQVNLLAGVTRVFAPNFLIGVLGGYETFDYRSDTLIGRLKGDGWTVGSYVGWKITQGVRFDAAVAYSGIGYEGAAGTAAGSFNGKRLFVSGGLTGTYANYGFEIEPSARVYALWERENAYTDTLGTIQTARDFSTGRASGGAKLSYPIPLSATAIIAPYIGLYGDYYFNSDSALAIAVPGAISTIVLDGWSARAIGGLTTRFSKCLSGKKLNPMNHL
jgi:uncharacterized repeat protein (TIGR01451 family)